jgi:hypothetical protein
VEEAADPASPLHDHFQWDDTIAGRQWRLQQARQLIRVTVEAIQYQQAAYHVRVFTSLTPDRVIEGGGYRVTALVMDTEALRQQLLADALMELSRFQRKYRSLMELIKVFDAIRQVREDLDDRSSAGDGDQPVA